MESFGFNQEDSISLLGFWLPIDNKEEPRVLFTSHVPLLPLLGVGIEVTVGSTLVACKDPDPYANVGWYGPVGITGDSGHRGPIGPTGDTGFVGPCCSRHAGPCGKKEREYFTGIGQTKLPKRISRQPKQRSLPRYCHNRRRKNYR